MQHDLQNTLSLLTRAPAVLNALLRDLPEAWTLRNEGETPGALSTSLGI